MELLNQDVKIQVRKALEPLENDLNILMFTVEGEKSSECETCPDTRRLIEEVVALNPKLSLQVVDVLHDPETAQAFNIDKVPAILIQKKAAQPQYPPFRMFGLPSGYEFGTLIEDILMVGRGKPRLSEQTLKEINRLERPVYIQVYVTPT